MIHNSFYAGLDGFEAFADYVDMPEDERVLRRAALARAHMPFRVSAYYAKLIRDACDVRDRASLLNVVLPVIGTPKFVGRFDPYGNRAYADDAANFIQHKYPRTLLFHPTNFCNSNCSFCYKTNEIRTDPTGADLGWKRKLQVALDYLAQHGEVDNILFTGGDPGALDPRLLMNYIDPLLRVPHVKTLRFATKVPAFDPLIMREPNLLSFFEQWNRGFGNASVKKHVAVITQINHPAEMTRDCLELVEALLAVGCSVRGQPAIVRGVNDDARTLAELLRRFTANRIQPYYFTVFMPVRGVEQYALPLHEVFGLYREAVGQVNGLEKRATLLASHDFGKLEVVGFLPNIRHPKQVVLRWHEVATPEHLPPLWNCYSIPQEMHDTFVLEYETGIHTVDQLFEHNHLPFINSAGRLEEPLADDEEDPDEDL